MTDFSKRQTLDELLYAEGAWTPYTIARAGGPCARSVHRMLEGHMPYRPTIRRLARVLGVAPHVVARAMVATIERNAAARGER